MVLSLLISTVLSWIVIALLAVALLALARQVGVLHMRVAPAGALTTAAGPAVGSSATAIPVTTIDGVTTTVGGHKHGTPLRLLMFVSAACPLCKGLIPMAKSFARDERVELTFIGDDDGLMPDLTEAARLGHQRSDMLGVPAGGAAKHL